VRNLLLALYPASWRTRYGEEFELILADRPLGPFDVADVLLGALDAHLHLRGLGAVSQHGKGFAMSHRIGGWAAILGGILWFTGLAGSATVGSEDDNQWGFVILAATVLLLVALTGLSAFQARRDPRLVWAAFAVPAIGACVSIVGLIGSGVVGDRPFIGDLSPWWVWMFGMMTMFIGSALFALATVRTQVLSRAGAVLLGVSSVIVIPMAMGISGGFPPELGQLLTVATMLAFVGGWVALGISALRADRSYPATIQGAMS
jgi:uncharacterized membrane protein